MDERTWQANELNYKLQREVEELKGHVQELRKDKQETSHRLSELELEIKTMRIVFGAQLQALGGGTSGLANGSMNQMSIAQQVAATLRNSSPLNNSRDSQQQNESTPISSRTAASAPRSQLNIKYGILNEQDSPLEVLPDKEAAQEVELMEKLLAKYKYGGAANGTNSIKANGEAAAAAATAADRESENHVVMQMEKDTFDLRRELQDAVAGKKSAEQRILT